MAFKAIHTVIVMYLELFMSMLLLDDGVGCEMRYSYKRIQYNQKPRRAKLSDEQIQRLLNDAGFVRWCSRASRGRQSSHRRTLMNHHPLPLLAIRQRPVSGKWKIRVTQRQQITLQVQSQNCKFKVRIMFVYKQKIIDIKRSFT